MFALFGRSFWVAGAPGLPSSLLACVLGPARFRLLSFRFIFCVWAPKDFQVSPALCLLYVLLFTNKNKVHVVLMELDEKVRNCTFHLKVPSSALSVVSSPLTRPSCVRLGTPSFPQRRHHACSWCDDCSEKRTGVRVRRGSLSALLGHGALQARFETVMSETSPFPQLVKSTSHVKMTKTMLLLETLDISTPRSTWPSEGLRA